MDCNHKETRQLEGRKMCEQCGKVKYAHSEWMTFDEDEEQFQEDQLIAWEKANGRTKS